MKNTSLIPKVSGPDNSMGSVHFQREDGKMIYPTPTRPTNNVPSFSLEKVRKLICVNKINSEVNEAKNASPRNSSTSTSNNSPPGNNVAMKKQIIKISTPSAGLQNLQLVKQVPHPNSIKVIKTVPASVLRNMIVRATIPLQMIVPDRNASLLDQLMASKIVDSLDGENADSMSSSSSTAGKSQEDPEGFDDLVVMPDGSRVPEASPVVLVKTSGDGYVLKDGQKFTFLAENSETPTHSLVVSADTSKKVVTGLLSKFAVLKRNVPVLEKFVPSYACIGLM
jgi:hypothetical protein